MDFTKIGYLLANVPIRHEIGAHSHLAAKDHFSSLKLLLAQDTEMTTVR